MRWVPTPYTDCDGHMRLAVNKTKSSWSLNSRRKESENKHTNTQKRPFKRSKYCKWGERISVSFNLDGYWPPSQREDLIGQRPCMKLMGHLCSLDQWFSNFHMHWNHLESLLEHRLLGPTPRINKCGRSGVGLKNLHLQEVARRCQCYSYRDHFENHWRGGIQPYQKAARREEVKYSNTSPPDIQPPARVSHLLNSIRNGKAKVLRSCSLLKLKKKYLSFPKDSINAIPSPWPFQVVGCLMASRCSYSRCPNLYMHSLT